MEFSKQEYWNGLLFPLQQSSQSRNWTCSSCCISCRQILYCWVTREVYIEVHKMQIVLSLNYIPIFNPLVSFLKFLEIGIIDNYLQYIYIYRNLPKTYFKQQSVTKYCASFPLSLPLPPFWLLVGLSWPYSQVRGTFSENWKFFWAMLFVKLYSRNSLI